MWPEGGDSKESMGAEGTRQRLGGVIEGQLPNVLYRVRLEDGRQIRCNVSGSAKFRMIRLLPGDAVHIELSKIDPGRGRIVDVG